MRIQKILACLFICVSLYGIPTSSAQEQILPLTRYHIDVELFPEEHSLEGRLNIVYIHNHKQSTDTLFIQLYPNAYSSGVSAFGKQQLKAGNVDFYFADEQSKGSISNMSFTVNNHDVALSTYKGHQDIAFLLPMQPIHHGDTVHISTKFTVKIPAVFSRMGYEGGTFQLSQWFPKLMKFSEEGWHKYPYLDMGEFYGDFADYQVDITVPSAYKVASTGLLQDSIEVNWYKELSSNPTAGNPRTSTQKTLRFLAHRVQDFAWFTDKNFIIEHDQVEIDNKSIDCWIFHRDSLGLVWTEAMNACTSSLTMFSEWVGPYQYPQMTIVGAHLEAGAGMEYPMVCLIGNMEYKLDLHAVIAHEIAHNWFYGMMAFDERRYPYLDEGLTTQLETRYMISKFGEESISSRAINAYPYNYDQYYYWNLKKKNRLPSIRLDVNNHSEFSYYLLYYNKAPNVYEYLRLVVGDEHWDACMRKLFQQYLFRHIQPHQFHQFLHDNLPIESDWVLEDYLTHEKEFDYYITEVKQHDDSLYLTINNGSGLLAPVILQQLAGDSVIWEQHFSAFANKKSIRLPQQANAESIRIYTGPLLVSYNARRSYVIEKKKISSKQLNLGLLVGYEPPERNSIFLMPLFAGNQYDGFMLGLGAHNITLPQHDFQFQLMPFYAIRSQKVTGQFNLSYDIFNKQRNLNYLRLILEGKSFSSFHHSHYSFTDSYKKIKGGIEYHIRKKLTSEYRSRIRGTYTRITEDYGIGVNYAEKEFRWATTDYQLFSVDFKIDRIHALSPSNLQLTLRQLHKDSRIDIEYLLSYRLRPQLWISNRIFAGYAAMNNTTKPSLGLNLTAAPSYGNVDYAYEQFLLARRSTEGAFSQQVYQQDLAFPLPMRFPLGQYAVGGNLNFTIDLGFIGLEPYFYYLLFSDIDWTDDFLFTTGLRLKIADDIIHINFPVANAHRLNETLKLQQHGSYHEQITFSINVKRLLPDRLIGNLFNIE